MPITYNGIGTRYHGRANSEKRVATCHSCRRNVSLVSYDTRLWFVVLFIPVIPLGRKRIIDECPVCRRHFVANADEWETRKQLSVSGAMEAYLANPTPENAMQAHQQMMNFHQSAEAAVFRREIADKFNQNAKLQAYLGDSLSAKGQTQDAGAYYHRALELRPDLPEARVGVAREHMRAGRLSEARGLLDFLEKPGAAQIYSLEPLETLAHVYLNAAKREEALDIFRHLLSELPALSKNHNFRATVKKCEKQLGRKSSILPKEKFSWKDTFKGRQAIPVGSFRISQRGLAIALIACAIVIAAMVGQNIYRSRHRALYIVNGFGKPATVEVRGVGTFHVGSMAEKVDLPEGRHHATISGPWREEMDFEIQSTFWDRFGTSSIWLLNVGGSALLTEDHVTYRSNNPPPAWVTAHFGKEIERIDHIDRPFTPLPPSLTLNHNTEQTLSHLDFSPAEPIQLIAYFQLQGRTAEAAALAEWRIKRHPDDDQALAMFVLLADKKHTENVLRAGLQRRPIAIQWHRLYQNLGHSREWESWVAIEYDGMLKAEPDNSALLYLRGRMAPEPHQAEEWYARSIKADAKNPYPHFALGYLRASSGDWEGARALFGHALELKPDDEQFADTLFTCRLALEDYDALEKELRGAVTKKPLDYSASSRLVDVLLAQDRPTEAAKVVTTYQQMERKAQIPEQSSGTPLLLRQLYYSGAEFDKLAKSAEKDRTPAGRATMFIADIERGKVADAARIHPLNEPKNEDPWHFLAVSLAWVASHDQEQANAWLQRALQLLKKGSSDDLRAAALFQKEASLSPDTLAGIFLDPKAKAILLTAAGIVHPEQRKELFAAARRYNVDRTFPYQLVKRITTGAN